MRLYSVSYARLPPLFSSVCMMTRSRSFHLCIVGGGLAGLATAFHAVNREAKNEAGYDKIMRITVLDSSPGPGIGGASSAPVALLHPLTPKGKLIWRGLEGFDETTAVMRATGYPEDTGARLYRSFKEESKFKSYLHRARGHAHLISPITSSQFYELFPKSLPGIVGAVRINSSRIVDTPKYLQGIWHYVKGNATEAVWKQCVVDDLSELRLQYDAIAVCCGDSSKDVWEKNSSDILPLTQTHGQSFLYKDPFERNGLKDALISSKYIIPHPSRPGYLLCGATRESTHRNSRDEDISDALSGIHELYPALRNCQSEGHWKGNRVIFKRKCSANLPVLVSHENIPECWLLTAFGSRGLIHHALLAKYLINAMIHKEVHQVPEALGI